MSFLALSSALIAAGITIPALLALYFLKRKRQLMQVSSTFLWRKALQDLEVNAPFQRIRRNMLLLLQMLILLGLLLAFARPTLREVAGAGQRVVIVIDHSASMNATDVKPSRLLQAKEQAMQLVEDLGGSEAMVISFAQQTRVVEPFTTDRARLRDGIRSIVATDQRSRIGPVLRLVEPFALKQAQPLVVYVISDGKVHEEDKMTLRGADLRFIGVGTGADNLGFVALGARRDYDRPEQVKIFARLINASDKPIDARVTLKVDSQVQTVDKVTVPAKTSDTMLQFDLVVAKDAFIQLAHDYGDLLAADNRVSLTIQPPRQVRVMLISDGNLFLERAIRAAGPAELVVTKPGQFDVKATRVRAMDVLVFDRFAPSELPLVDSLYLGCSPAISGLKMKASKGKSSMLDWRREHPLLRYVALDDVAISQQIHLELPDEAVTLGSAEHGPMMALVQVDRVRHVVVGFDVLKSNWPMQISFPVFVTNAINWLSTSGAADAGSSYQPGQVAVVEVEPGREAVNYIGPRKLSVKAKDGQAILPAFERVGMYFSRNTSGRKQRILSVNLVDARESDILPADQLNIGSKAVQAVNKSSSIVRREVWSWFIWITLAVLLVEWVVYTRRMHL
jgi:hypothetical protein